MSDPTSRASDEIRTRLYREAKGMARPEIRQATIDRLAQACDEIASGRGARTVKAAYGKDFGLGLNPKITPSSIDRYIKARRIKDRSWSGPTRAFLQNDEGLLNYVRAREDERQKPSLPRRASPSRRRLEEALETIPNADDRQFVRLEVERFRRLRNELEILKTGLRKMAPIDIDAILEGRAGIVQGRESGSAEVLAPLVDRLHDEEDMSRIGLAMVGGRLACRTTRQTLVKKKEMEVLKSMVGKTLQLTNDDDTDRWDDED